MTSNQLTYWANVERQRSNLANEAETQRSNLAREQETTRHNIEQERIGWQSSLASLIGAYASRASAGAAWQQAYNQQQKVANDYNLGMFNLEEAQRHNYASEAEIYRHNLRQEDIGGTGSILNFGSSLVGSIFGGVLGRVIGAK